MATSAQNGRRSSRAAKTSLPRSDADISIWRRGLSFLLIVSITSALVVFVMFMQHRWRLTGLRAIAVVHNTQDEVRKPLSIVVYEPEQKHTTVITVPRDQQLLLWSSPAQYAADALIGFAMLEDVEWQFVQFQLFLEYGVVVDGIVWSSLSVEELQTPRGVERLAWSLLRPRRESTLTYYDRWKWWSWTHRVLSPSYSNTTPPLLTEQQLDNSSYDRWANTRVQDPQVRRSRWSIAIVNASGKQGQAQRLARGLRLLGYEVRQVDTIEPQEKSELVFAPSKDSSTQEAEWARVRLREVLGWAVREDEALTSQRRSDAVVVIGQDQ